MAAAGGRGGGGGGGGRGGGDVAWHPARKSPPQTPTQPTLSLVTTSVWSCCHIFDAGSCGRRCLASFSQASFAAQAASLQLAWPHFTLTTLTSVLPSSSRVV